MYGVVRLEYHPVSSASGVASGCLAPPTNYSLSLSLSLLLRPAPLIASRFTSRHFTRKFVLRTGFYWVLLGFKGIYWVLMGFTGFYWVLLGFRKILPVFTGFYWVLLGCTGFYWVLLGFPGFSWIFLGFPGFSWVFLGFRKILPVFTGFYWVLLGCAGFYWVLLGFNIHFTRKFVLVSFVLFLSLFPRPRLIDSSTNQRSSAKVAPIEFRSTFEFFISSRTELYTVPRHFLALPVR